MQGVLIVVAGPHVGSTFDLDGDYAVIGRAPEVEIALIEDDLVSRTHARVLRTRKGFLIRDLDSANGTFVNGRRISGSALLDPGDMIRTGSVVMRFDADVPGGTRSKGSRAVESS
jgi:pSer/pThr/pTyr-binding forkhead associated (FHA) protein